MIKVNMSIAKELAHNIRREKRSEEFVSIDGNSANVLVTPEAEAERETIRTKYADMQEGIDAASDEVQLKQVMIENNLV